MVENQNPKIFKQIYDMQKNLDDYHMRYNAKAMEFVNIMTPIMKINIESKNNN